MVLEPAEISSVSDRTEYTCPMHPEIVRDQPGNCPICGMALELRDVSVDAANPELANMTRRFWVAVALTVPLLAVMVSDVLPGHPLQHLLTGQWLAWRSLCLRRQWSYGLAGRSLNAAGPPSFIAVQICLRQEFSPGPFATDPAQSTPASPRLIAGSASPNEP
jgi:hypothetical protein